MEQKKSKTLSIFGAVFVIYWLLDFWHNAVETNDYSWLLWYSSAGFLLTGIALIIQNEKLICSLFCALFMIESFWLIDLFYVIFRHKTLFGLTEYILSPSFDKKDLYFTLYHALIPIGLLIAVIRIKKVYRYGWLGAVIFTFALAFLTYFLLSPESQVNCLHSVNQCHTVFSFLYKLNDPYRIFAALAGMTLLIFIPTNYALIYFKEFGE